MNIPFPDFESLFPHGTWIVPVIGGAACGLAFLIGRLLLVSKPSPPPVDPEGPTETNFLQGITRDRRIAPRRKGNTVEVQISIDERSDPTRGWVLDRSIGGIGILVDEPIAQGAVIKIRPRTATVTAGWIEVTVRACRREGHQFELGCQFHRTPDWNTLLHFG